MRIMNSGKMRAIKLTAFLPALLLLMGSCHKIQVLPPEPHIEFKTFAVFDTTDILGNKSKGGRLNIHFEDGDGDLGLKSGVEDSTNMYLTMYRKVQGQMQQVPDNDLLKPSPYRIPYMERTGNNKILTGTITVAILYLFYDTADNDTIMYDIVIKDRAGNYSNTVSTCEIALSYNNIYRNPE